MGFFWWAAPGVRVSGEHSAVNRRSTGLESSASSLLPSPRSLLPSPFSPLPAPRSPLPAPCSLLPAPRPPATDGGFLPNLPKTQLFSGFSLVLYHHQWNSISPPAGIDNVSFWKKHGENTGFGFLGCYVFTKRREGNTVGNALRGVPLAPERRGGRSLQDLGRRKCYLSLNHAQTRSRLRALLCGAEAEVLP